MEFKGFSAHFAVMPESADTPERPNREGEGASSTLVGTSFPLGISRLDRSKLEIRLGGIVDGNGLYGASLSFERVPEGIASGVI